jgi:anti-sigma regulatory factor (Ser/Thr protein kinase)
MNIAELLVSELVSNSVRHSHLPPQSPIVLRVRAEAQRLYVEVEDAGWGFAEPDATDPGSDDGG